MAGARFRRLEQVLGGRIDEVGWPALEELVSAAVPEAPDLDFKQAHYGTSDNDKRELAKDVAALANTSGGVILIGIEEREGVASELRPLPFADEDERRYRQIVGNLVAPLPSFDVRRIPNPANTEAGVLAIVVPKSPLAPHAVAVNDGLRFPRRHGTVTFYLGEAEVATSYRQRFSLGPERQQLLLAREQEFLATLDGSELWLVLTSVPDIPGEFPINSATLRDWQARLMTGHAGMPWYGRNYQSVSAGFRRIRAHGGGTQDSLAKFCALELHADGSAVYGMRLIDLSRRERQTDPTKQALLHDTSVAAAQRHFDRV